MPDTSVAPATLNAALSAYVQTVPNIDRLHGHLRAQGLSMHQPQIEAELRALMQSADDFLYGQAQGTKWDAAFNERFYQHLLANHAWLSRDAFRALGSYGQWLSWHEGLGL